MENRSHETLQQTILAGIQTLIASVDVHTILQSVFEFYTALPQVKACKVSFLKHNMFYPDSEIECNHSWYWDIISITDDEALIATVELAFEKEISPDLEDRLKTYMSVLKTLLQKYDLEREVAYKQAVIESQEETNREDIEYYEEILHEKNTKLEHIFNSQIEQEHSSNNQSRLFDMVFDHMLDSVVLLDKDYNFLKVSRSYAHACQREIHEFIGRNHFEMYPSDLKEELEPYRQNKAIYYRKARPFTFPDHPEWGTTYWDLGLVPILDETGEIELFIFTLKDVTKEIVAKQDLLTVKQQVEESEQKFRTLVEATSDWIWEITLDGKFTYVSPRIFDLLGYTPEEIMGKTAFDLMSEEEAERVGEVYDLFVQNEEPFTGMINVNLHKDGHEVVIESSGVPIFSNSGKCIGYRGIDRDITERKENEKALKVAKEKAEESDRLKTEFINNMSHEIRTPLNGILGFSKQLSKPALSLDQRLNYCNVIRNSGDQLLQVIDSILEISKLGTNQVKPLIEDVCVRELLWNVFTVSEPRAKERKVPMYLKTEISESESYIKTDKLLLEKIVSILLNNALKYTHEGFIEIGCKLTSYDDFQFLDIYVQDTGEGILVERQDLIFDRFAQEDSRLSTEKSGLGLGLSIAKENARLLGGSILLNSVKGVGSTFTLRLPYVKTDKKIMKETSSQKTEKEYTVLIAEDEQINYLILSVLLEKTISFPCKVLHAKNGKEAVDICTQNDVIDIVLMDIKMPVMDGYEATKTIKEFRPDVPIIAQTAYTSSEDRAKALECGVDEVLSKPLDETLLDNALRRYLHIEPYNHEPSLN